MENNETELQDHFISKLNKNLDANIFGTFSLSKRKLESPSKLRELPIKNVAREQIKFDKFIKVNKIFNEYVASLKKSNDISLFMQSLYKCELTGAMIVVDGKSCIIVEERKNSFVVVYKDNRVKILLKNVCNFYIEILGIKYLFICKHLKINRFLKK